MPEGQGAMQGLGGRGALVETEAGFPPRRANPVTAQAHRCVSHVACSSRGVFTDTHRTGREP